MALLLCAGHSLCVSTGNAAVRKAGPSRSLPGPHTGAPTESYSFGEARARGRSGQDRLEDRAAAGQGGGGQSSQAGGAGGGRGQGARGRPGGRQVGPPGPDFPSLQLIAVIVFAFQKQSLSETGPATSPPPTGGFSGKTAQAGALKTVSDLQKSA